MRSLAALAASIVVAAAVTATSSTAEAGHCGYWRWHPYYGQVYVPRRCDYRYHGYYVPYYGYPYYRPYYGYPYYHHRYYGPRVRVWFHF